MGPRLQLELLPDGRGEALAPAQPGERLVDIDLGIGMDQPRVAPHIVVDGRQLDQLAEKGDGARLAQVLVADDGLGDRFGLGLRGPEFLSDEV